MSLGLFLELKTREYYIYCEQILLEISVYVFTILVAMRCDVVGSVLRFNCLKKFNHIFLEWKKK